MKKKKMIHSCLIILLILILGLKPVNETYIKVKVWSILSKESKEEIIGNWTDAKIEKWEVKDKSFFIDEKYYGKRVYHVVFRTRNDGLLGPIGVYVDPWTKEIVGGDTRE